MSNVTLVYPKQDSYVLYWHVNGWLPQFFYKDSKGNPSQLTSEEHTIGFIKNGTKKDCYQNKDVKHFKVSGTIDLTPIQMKWIGNKFYDYPMYWNSLNTPNFIRYGFIATGNHSVYNGYLTVVDRNDSTCASGRYLRDPDGALLGTFTITNIFIGYKANKLMYKVRYVTKTTALGKNSRYKLSEDDYVNEGEAYAGGIQNTGAFISAAQSYDAARRLIPSFVPPVLGDIRPDSLTDDIYSQLVIPEVNNCENLKDFRDFQKILPDLLKLIKQRKKNFKTLAEFWLWYKYSYSTTKLDIMAYYKFFCDWFEQAKSRQDYKKMHITYNDTPIYNGVSYMRNTSYMIYTNTYNCGVLEALGLDLNLGNTWDMVPFSFVVDWFVNLGDILARIDHSDTLAKLDVYSVLTSTKCTSNYSLGAIGGVGTLIISYFERNLSSSLPVGNISVSLKNPLHHILDGTSLIVARH